MAWRLSEFIIYIDYPNLEEFNKETRFVRKKKKKYHCTENQNLNLNTERHRQTSLWIGFLIIRLFGNLSDNFIYRGNFSWLSDSQSNFWLFEYHV